MINSSLESPSQDESNGGKIIFLGAIDRNLSNNLSFCITHDLLQLER